MVKIFSTKALMSFNKKKLNSLIICFDYIYFTGIKEQRNNFLKNVSIYE